MHVIYNGVDPEHFHPGLRDEHRATMRAKVGADETAPIILFVGSGFARKGVATLIEALVACVHRTRKSGSSAATSSRHATSAWPANAASPVACVSLARKPTCGPLYAAADVFCLPTLYDPLPNAALEALACGLPVATTTTCGAAELIEPGVNGYVCAALDPVALAGQPRRTLLRQTWPGQWARPHVPVSRR